MAAELTHAFKAEVNLIAGSGGVLDVVVDGKELFSKKKAGHFPSAHELILLIQQL